MEQAPIQHISDTALWIAAFRGLESQRPDAAFNDHLGLTLAGERGLEIVKATPFSEAMAFAMVMRTSGIDRLVLQAVDKGVDTVINLAAGLDTRPYRLKLPPTLRWIEVDLPGIIQFKQEKLSHEQPVCLLERMTTDLTNDQERKKLFEQLGRETKKALVITEGLIGYLTNEQAEKLSRDLAAVPGFKYWIMDFNQGKRRKNSYSKKLKNILKNSPLRFTDAAPLQFFGKQGWKVDEIIYILDEAGRLKRKLPMTWQMKVMMALFGKKLRAMANKTYGYVMFGKN
jgi:methyltransferase (TIGR00027 family)